MSQSDICFIIDKFEIFINKNANVQYTSFKQKEIARLLEKKVFQVVISKDVSSNTQIFNSCFINKIKNPDIDKVYKKSCLVIWVSNDKDKNFILT